jgi:hypothetical protein
MVSFLLLLSCLVVVRFVMQKALSALAALGLFSFQANQLVCCRTTTECEFEVRLDILDEHIDLLHAVLATHPSSLLEPRGGEQCLHASDRVPELCKRSRLLRTFASWTCIVMPFDFSFFSLAL